MRFFDWSIYCYMWWSPALLWKINLRYIIHFNQFLLSGRARKWTNILLWGYYYQQALHIDGCSLPQRNNLVSGRRTWSGVQDRRMVCSMLFCEWLREGCRFLCVRTLRCRISFLGHFSVNSGYSATASITTLIGYLLCCSLLYLKVRFQPIMANSPK